MPQITYQNFSLRIARKDEANKTYSVSVQGAPGGENSAEFSIKDLEIQTSAISLSVNGQTSGLVVSRNAKLVSAPAPGSDPQVQRVQPPDYPEAKQLGTVLFNAIFKQKIRDLFNTSLGSVRRTHGSEKLRLQFNLTEAPELAVLPWELIFNAENSSFYAQSTETPIVRYLDIPMPIRTLRVSPPLNVLVAISNPSDQAQLDSEAELGKLKNAVAGLERDGLIQLDRLEKATLYDLRKKLKEKEYHVFHFIGHGSFKEGTGTLIFENNQGQSAPVNGNFLGMQLATYDTLRLAIINACEGASSSNNDSYAGIAQNLLQRGNLPAVIAMQFAITDNAAVRFAEVFYDSLAAGSPVDFALSRARVEMIESQEDVEWATPVLFMRSNSGELFDTSLPITHGPSEERPGERLPPDPLHHLYQEMLAALRDGQLVFILGLETNLYGRQEDPDWKPGTTLPSNSELSSYLARELQFQIEGRYGLANISQQAFVGRKKNLLINLLGRIFTPAGITPSTLHYFIADLFARIEAEKNFLLTEDQTFRRSVIVTTTYDSILEKAFLDNREGPRRVPSFNVISYQAEESWTGKFLHTKYANGERVSSVIIEQPNEYRGLAGDTTPVIIKIPGAVEGIEFRYAIAEDNFFSFAGRSLPRLLPPQLMIKLQNSRQFYLGYKVRDWTLRALLYSIWGTERQQRMESWALLPEANRDDKLYWESCDVQVVEAALESFVEGLRKRAEAYRV